MNYSKFSIKNYRCFSDTQNLLFALPEQGKTGSGITYIVGANNSGKTTLIEAIWLGKHQRIRSTEKRQDGGPEFQLFDSDAQCVRNVHLIDGTKYLLTAEPDLNNKNDLFDIISSRRDWESVSSDHGPLGLNYFVEESRKASPRQQQKTRTASMLKEIERNKDQCTKFTKLVKEVIPGFHQWAVAFETNEYIEYQSNDGTKHASDFLGSGVISIMRIIAHLCEDSHRPLIIDEPELSLHPQTQKNLITLLAEFSQDRQIIISTHSPYFIRWDYISNGAKINRVSNRDDASGSRINTLKEPANYITLWRGENWSQPFAMDEVAKEIFFADDNILFLEGQEDVGLLRNEFSDTNIHLFGYGVRGCGNFKVALQMAKDLGFQKVGALLDNNPEEPGIKSKLEKDFSAENYKIVQWNKKDIRDKPKLEKAAVDGYFLEGKIKSNDKLDDFWSKIDEIKTYFQSSS